MCFSPTVVTMIRHGESAENELYRRAEAAGTAVGALGAPDAYPLTEFGRECSLRLGQYLRDELRTFDVVFVSPFLRARQTWKEMLRAVPDAERSSLMARTIVEPLVVEYSPESESPIDVLNRYAAFCSRWSAATTRKRVLLVTHGNFIRAVRAFHEGGVDRFVELLSWDKTAVGKRVWNCSLSTLEPKADGCRLVDWGREVVSVEREYR